MLVVSMLGGKKEGNTLTTSEFRAAVAQGDILNAKFLEGDQIITGDYDGPGGTYRAPYLAESGRRAGEAARRRRGAVRLRSPAPEHVDQHPHHGDPAGRPDRRGAALGDEPLAGRRRARHAVRPQPAQDRARRTSRRRRSPTSPAWTRRSRSSRRSRNTSSRPPSSRRWARRSRGACCCSGHRGRARRCSRAPWPVRRACRSSRSAGRTSSRCSSAWGPRASATCSSRRRRPLRRSCSSTRSTPSVVTAARDSAEVTTSASRRSTSSSWRWTGSTSVRPSS